MKARAKQFAPREVYWSLYTAYEEELDPGLLQSSQDWQETGLLLANRRRLLEQQKGGKKACFPRPLWTLLEEMDSNCSQISEDR